MAHVTLSGTYAWNPNLCRRLLPGRGSEQDVIGSLAVKRRVEVDEVYALVLDVRSENVQIVTIIKMVGHFPSQMPKFEKAGNTF